MPRLGIQLPSSTNWKPPPTLNSADMNNERTKDDNQAPNAIPFNNVSLALEAKRMMLQPNRGREMIRLSDEHLRFSYPLRSNLQGRLTADSRLLASRLYQ